MAVSASVDKAPVGHHFDNLRQQQSAVRFGMWMLLVTEVLFFGGVFCAYAGYRYWFPNEFTAGSAVLNVGIASVNTFLLLTSSLTMTLAIRACYVGSVPGLKMYLMLTVVLGSLFLGLKMREYYLDYEEQLIPTNRTVQYFDSASGRMITESAFIAPLRHALDQVGFKYVESGAGRTFEQITRAEELKKQGYMEVDLHRVQLFFLFYYFMTGLHVVHMIVGIGLLLWQYILASTGFFRYAERYVYVEVMSLYWHFVDMVWMFLLPLLYLAGPHSWSQAGSQFLQAIGLAAGH